VNESIVISGSVITESKKRDEYEEELIIKDTSSSKKEFDNLRPAGTSKSKEPESISSRPSGLKVVGKIDLNTGKAVLPEQEPKVQKPAKKEVESVAEPQNISTETPQKVEVPEKQPELVIEEAKPEKKAEVKPEVIPEPPVSISPTEKETPPVVSQKPKVEVPSEPKSQPISKETTPVVVVVKTEQDNTATTPITPEESLLKPESEAIKTQPTLANQKSSPEEPEVIEAKAERLQGLTVLGKIELPDPRKKTTGNKPVASSDDSKDKGKRKRKRIKNANTTTPAKPGTPGEQNKPADDANKGGQRQQTGNNDTRRNPNNNSRPATNNQGGNKGRGPMHKPVVKEEVSDKEIQDTIKNTLAKLSGNKPKQSLKRQIKRDKRATARRTEELSQMEVENKVLKVTEFISANELAVLMDVSVNEIISKCLSFGMFVAINQRLDAEAITIIADEFGYEVEFISAEQEISVNLDQNDTDEDLKPRAPIVTIMGHVDHGKTSLLDYIRKSKIAEGEAGGITQHIGAYDVMTNSGKKIAFLDTPGHEAFTAMRARGAKLTDVAIIVIAADDSVMPQTIEAINHAQVAGVPMVFAINKIDKAGAQPEKIKEALANLNILVEDWGGKYQCQEISAKKGIGVDELLEKVLLEAEMQDLKANPNKNALGTVIEALLDKGKGYLATIMVEAGTLRKGDILLAGAHYGRVKALMDHRGKIVEAAGPATPVQVLGLNGAPQAGDRFNVLDSEREAKEIAFKRDQIMREQSMRATKRTTLSDLGRRIALGNFKQLNIIVKGDVDGSVEALSDSLLKLSTDEIEVNIIHKAVGQISESDVLLSAASDAIIIGFQVRPSSNARKMADKEEVEIRFYSIIYDAINDVKDAMEGLLSPTIEEHILGSAEVREVFKISKVGTVAGCYVNEGIIKRNSKVRVLRDGIVVHGGNNSGEINALKRFKDDVNEVKSGFECGMSIRNFNDLRTGDVIEAFEEREIKRKL
jgi:translation initiation factor IF-2